MAGNAIFGITIKVLCSAFTQISELWQEFGNLQAGGGFESW
jgi:hypothetical protein